MKRTFPARISETELSSVPAVDRPSSSDAPPRPAAGRRKVFLPLVVVALGGCAFILVAAGLARMAHHKEEPATSSPLGTASSPLFAEPASSSAQASPAAAPAPEQAPTSAPGTADSGSVVLVRPAVPGQVWLDGKRMSSPSVSVSCGKHRLKVGQWGHTRAVSIPCGGELRVSR